MAQPEPPSQVEILSAFGLYSLIHGKLKVIFHRVRCHRWIFREHKRHHFSHPLDPAPNADVGQGITMAFVVASSCSKIGRAHV